MSSRLTSIDKGIAEIKAGRPIILIDDDDRENEGDFVCAAELCTPELVNLMMSHGRGLICLPLARALAHGLRLPPQAQRNEAPLGTAFTVSIDAARGITTGISAADRCRTILAAAAEKAGPADLVRPGHIFPLVAREGGCLVRPGHTEAAVDLVKLADLRPAAVICEILNESGAASNLAELRVLAESFGLALCSIRDLVDYRLAKEPLVSLVETVELPTRHGQFHLHIFRALCAGIDETYLALVHGRERFTAEDLPLVRVHAEWSIQSLVARLQVGESALEAAMSAVAEADSGVILFLRHSPEPRTVPVFAAGQPDHDSPLLPAGTGYGLGAQVLRHLGVRRMRLLSDNEQPIPGLNLFGLEIVRREALRGSDAKHG